MKLVATWLNGIGLSDAISTFEAAGIVSPSALAELDVNHFEALGVSDPDDRRKLFYLVQRIKLAVGKKDDAPEEESMEAQVDALISGTLDSRGTGSSQGSASEEQKENNHDNRSRSEYVSDNGASYAVGPSDGPAKEVRRSRRLATKQTPDETVAMSTAPATATLSSSTTSESNRRISRRLQEKQADDGVDTRVKSKSPSRSERSERRSLTSTSTAGADFSTRSDPAGIAAPKSVAANANITASTASTAVSTTGSSMHNAVPIGGMALPTLPQRTRAQPSTRGRRPESRLQNPSKSIRTGKTLSSIPSESIAPQSPLLELQLGQTPNDSVDYLTNAIAQPIRRRSTSRDSLDSLLESSVSESEDYQSEPESEPDVPKSVVASTSRRLSFQHRQPDSVQSLDDESNKSKRSSRKSHQPPQRHTGRPSRGYARSATSMSVQSGSETESFKTKIENLREDNASEYELFADEAAKQHYYDMRIRVIVRKRPLSAGGVDIIQPLDYGEYGKVLAYQPKTRVDLTKQVETVPFAFDNVFDETSTNVQIYKRSIRGLIPSVFEGQYNSVFAYGQTGSGKTYTMMGSNITGVNAGTAVHDDANLGLYYLAALDLFELARRPEYSDFTIAVSLFEIYGGKLYDLLADRKPVKCLENSRGKVCFPGLSEHSVSDPDTLMELFEKGARNRSTGTTSRNADSSRSHAVIQLSLHKKDRRRKNVEHGRLTFIDLAGSERGADTSSASRATRLEGAEINTSLLALKEVIRALATGKSMTHIPFRGSKLTQVLKDSFVGKNSRCCMVACMSADIGNCEQTLNTLRYADRVKERNPNTGAVASGYDTPVRVEHDVFRTQSQATLSDDYDYDDDAESNPTSAVVSAENDFNNYEDNNADNDSSSVVSESNSDILNELLTSDHDKMSGASKRNSLVQEQSQELTMTPKRVASETLVANHRSVMASMLSMVKHEMVLVNKVDADRDRLDEYIAELESLQKTQLSLITKLQGNLHSYVAHAEGSVGAQIKVRVKGKSTDEQSDNDSFEDLRD